jgi:1-deoxy-D-xylulose 5-phosphate reductoisomerase
MYSVTFIFTVKSEHAAFLQRLHEEMYSMTFIFTVKSEHAAFLQRLHEDHQQEIHRALTKSKAGLKYHWEISFVVRSCQSRYSNGSVVNWGQLGKRLWG